MLFELEKGNMGLSWIGIINSRRLGLLAGFMHMLASPVTYIINVIN